MSWDNGKPNSSCQQHRLQCFLRSLLGVEADLRREDVSSAATQASEVEIALSMS